MRIKWTSSGLWAGILVALSFGLALFFRVFLPYDKVFTTNFIKFTGADAYFQMRLVDNLVHNFPHLLSFDPYFVYPGGSAIISPHFFVRLLSGVTWLAGLGSPSQHTIDIVGVYFPAILGALIVIPVFFIGKELFGRWAGVLSAGLVALLPGELLGRSILGFTDQHIAETLFTTVTILFLILAVKAAKEKQLTFGHLKDGGWAMFATPLIYSLLAGIFLSIYILTWIGALLFVFIIAVYFVVQFIIDHMKGNSTDYLAFIGGILFLVALITTLLISSTTPIRISMVAALLIPLVLNAISRLMSKRINVAYYPLALAVGVGVVLGLFWLISPSLLSSMWEMFSIFRPQGAQLTTIEMQPILFPGGSFSFAIAWGNFTTAAFLSIIALGILIYLVVKRGEADKTLLVVWSLIMLAAVLGQRRFGYYFAVNAALLTGYLSWRALGLVGLKEVSGKVAADAKEAKGGRLRARESGFRISSSQINITFVTLIVLVVAFLPNIQPTIETGSQARYAPSDGWCSSLAWVKENTPEPLGDPDSYYSGSLSHEYPDSAYGVLAWWDYGYWITRMAHRIPNANPSQDPVAQTNVARFFTSQEEGSANEIAQALASKYVIIDHETAISKFWAIATWAGRDPTGFLDTYGVVQDNQLRAVLLYEPEYYRSLSTRLYSFDGEAVVPENTFVISYQEEVDLNGTRFKRVTSAEQFTSYEEAEDYLSSQESGNYKIVGVDPFVSPVPLEAMTDYHLVYESADNITGSQGQTMPAVKVFEYTGNRGG